MVLDCELERDLKSHSTKEEAQQNGCRLETEKMNKVSKYHGRSITEKVLVWELRSDLKSQSIAEEAQQNGFTLGTGK